jgi:hypothetical protein
MAETVFSTFKRLFGEYASSIKFRHLIKEMTLKASLYAPFTAMTQESNVPRTEETDKKPRNSRLFKKAHPPTYWACHIMHDHDRHFEQAQSRVCVGYGIRKNIGN